LIGSIEGSIEIDEGGGGAALGDTAALLATFHFDSFTAAIRGGAAAPAHFLACLE
jgi:hypothetical protein